MEYTPTTCENCKRTIMQAADKCPSCGFPITGTEVQKELFYHQLEARKLQLKDLESKVDNARITLWVIAGLNFVFGLLSYLFNSELEDALFVLIINALVSLMFVFIGTWATQKPFSALVTGLLIYIGLFLFTVINGQHMSGIIGRLILIGYLIKGISSAREAEEVRKDLAKREANRQ